MRHIRQWALLAAAFTLTAALSGCGAPGGSSGPGAATLRLVVAEHGDRSGNSSKRYWDRLAGEFTHRHPGITVDIDIYDRDEVDEKVAAMVADGRAPDLAQLGGSYAPYAARDKLYNATDVLSTPTQASFVPSLADAGTVRRVQYGLPFAAATRALFYNKKLFARAGLSTPPRTWDELHDDAQALRASGVRTPFSLPLGAEDAQAEALSWILAGGGSGYTDDAGGYTIDTKQNRATFAWLRDKLVGQGLTCKAPAATDREEAYDDFVHGSAAMVNGHPTLMERALENGVDFGTAPLPGRTGPAAETAGVTDWLVAFKQRGHREQLRSFLDFAYRENHVRDYAEQYDLLPVTVPASDAMRAAPEQRAMRPFLDSLDSAVFYPLGSPSWPPVSRELRLTIGEAVTRSGNPTKVLTQIQRKATQAETKSATATP